MLAEKKLSSTIKVIVETKAYLKKYLHAAYGDDILFSQNSQWGEQLLNITKKSTGRSVSASYDTLMEVRFAKSILASCNGGESKISHQNHIYINSIFETHFLAQVWRFCTTMNILGFGLKDSLTDFCNSFGIVIGEDISMNTLVQKELRHRQYMKLTNPDSCPEKVKKEIMKVVLHIPRPA